jgi:glutathione synthase/RimK-type ligase-like ATP-grasp enzyme
LANLLVKKDQVELARHHFETALRLAPDHPDAHQGLAFLLAGLGDEETTSFHRTKAFGHRPVLTFPYRGKNRPIEALVLASAVGSAVPIMQHLDDTVFAASVLFVDFHDRVASLPAHRVIFNAVGDADLCQASLAALAEVMKRSAMPVINRPEFVMPTGRVENARRLGSLPGVRTPKMALMPRTRLERPSAADELAEEFGYPLLLRSPGFHTGRFFVRVDDPQGVSAAVSGMPGRELLVIEYLDARSPDGKIRKYRVMMIGGELHPLHAAVSHDWKIHYFSAEMAENAENRTEDATFLEDMEAVIGPGAIAALTAIRDRLGLDYAGADFSLGPEGDVLLFEANAMMVVNPAEADARWDYRRPAVRRVLDAIRALLTKHAGDARGSF